MVLERAMNTVIEGDNPDTGMLPGYCAETQGDTLRVSGDVDLYVAAIFRQAGVLHVREHTTPTIDLTGVAFLDSAGLAALLYIAKVARSCEHPLRVLAVGNPRRVLRITGIDRMLLMD